MGLNVSRVNHWDRYGSEDHDTWRSTCTGVPENEIHEATWPSSYACTITSAAAWRIPSNNVFAIAFSYDTNSKFVRLRKLVPGKLRKYDDFMEPVT